MIKRILFLLLVTINQFAFASKPQLQYSHMVYKQSDAWVNSLNAACDGMANYQTAYQAANNAGEMTASCARVVAPTEIHLTLLCVKSSCGPVGSQRDWSYSVSTRAWCVATNTAPDYSKPEDQMCADPPPTCKAGMQDDGWYPVRGNKTGFPACSYSGCAITTKEVGSCVTLASTGATECHIYGTMTGSVCSNGDPEVNGNYGAEKDKAPTGATTKTDIPATKVPDKNTPCPKGSVQGGSDSSGIPICIGSGTGSGSTKTPDVTTKPATTTTGSDGSSTTTQQTTQVNTDGSVTTTTTTTVKAPDGSVTVSQKSDTSKSATGGEGKADNPKADESNLCKQNPMLSICRNSSVTGTCGEIACDGDAIQCATLRAAAAMECKQRKTDEELQASDIYTLGKATAAGNDPQAKNLPSVQNASQVAIPTSMNTAGFLGGGAPFPDVTVQIQGKAITIPFTKWTGYLLPLRYVMMIIATLVSFKMLSGTILRE